MEKRSELAGIVESNIEILQENMKLKRELEDTKAELEKLRRRMVLQAKWNHSLREEKNERIREALAEMPRSRWEAAVAWMTPQWAIGVIAGTAVMSLLSLAIAWLAI